MIDPPTPSPASRRRPGQKLVRWGVVILFAITASLVIDITRQALSEDQVQWNELASAAQYEAFFAPNPQNRYASLPKTAVPVGQTAPAASKPASPRLLYFTADWCGPCQQMRANVFSKTPVADAIHARFSAHKVDLTQPNPQQQQMATRFEVASIPTLLILDTQGRVVRRLERAVDDATLLDWLQAGYQDALPQAPRPLVSGSFLGQNKP